MNKQEAIEIIKNLYSFIMEDGPFEVGLINKNHALDIISQIDEPQKVVVPKFVADLYEAIKDDFENKVYDFCVQFDSDNCELSSEVWGWFDCGKNEPIQTLVKMKLYGYEIEQEKLYTVEIEGISSGKLFKNIQTNKYLFHSGNGLNGYTDKLTETEIKQKDERLWQFTKEVENV